MRKVALALFAGGLVVVACLAPGRDVPAGGRWLRGNTHTHTLWSDGDGAPELVAAWYRERGYDFLVLSDHNVLSRGERWVPVEDAGPLTEGHVAELVERFGAGAVDVRERDGRREMRLRTLDELRARFEAPGEFLFLEGQEITDEFAERPVHVNGVGLAELIEPQGGRTLRATLNANVAAVAAQSRRTGRPMLAHVNHPNFGWGISWEDLAHVAGDRFFEVYNGHPGVRNHGDADRPGTEEMWDLANTLRLLELDLPLLFGVATDDSHDYHAWGVGHVNPGRGWVMVRADELSADSIVRAMQRGDFYASSGVSVRDVNAEGGRYRVEIEAEAGVEYKTRFLGTLLVDGEPIAIGEVLSETGANPATYTFRGDELYVRAVVVSSRLHPNPYAAGDLETAWLQPVALGRATR